MEKAKNTKQKIVSQGRVIDFVPRRNGVSLSKRPLSLGMSGQPRLRVEPRRGLEIDIANKPKARSMSSARKAMSKTSKADVMVKKTSARNMKNGAMRRPTRLSAAAAGMTVGEMMAQQRVTTRKVVEKFDDEFGLIEESEIVREMVGAPVPKKAQKSPFLNSVMVDKRPLGKGAERNSSPNRRTVQPVRRIEPMEVVKPESKKSAFPLVGLIILTIIVGGAVGAAVYLFLFQ